MVRPRFKAPFSLEQQQFLALCPKITALPSIVGSAYIVQHIVRSPKRCRRVYHRLLLGMSVMDFIWSVKSFCSTWPIPSYTGIYLASGTTQTCAAAGFFGHGAALTSAMYSGTLTLYYLLTIRYGWKQERIRRYEPVVLHAFPLAIGWATAIAGLPLLLFNPIGWTCWIGPWPPLCGQGGTCARGENAFLYQWLFFHMLLWASFAFVAVAMWLIYCKIRSQERTVEKYQMKGTVAMRTSPSSMIGAGGEDGGGAPTIAPQNTDAANAASTSTAVGTASSITPTPGETTPRSTSRRWLPWKREPIDSWRHRPRRGRRRNQHQQQLRSGSSRSVIRIGGGGSRSGSDDYASHDTGSQFLFEEGDRSSKDELDGSMATSESQAHGALRPSTLPLPSPQEGGGVGSPTATSVTTVQTISDSKSLSRKFAVQASFYVAAFFVTWIFPMVQFAYIQTSDGTLLFPLLALTVIFAPLQGFFDALIYIRPRYIRYKERLQKRRSSHNSRPDQHSGAGRGLAMTHSLQILAQAVSVRAEDDEDDLDAQEAHEKEQSTEPRYNEGGALASAEKQIGVDPVHELGGDVVGDDTGGGDVPSPRPRGVADGDIELGELSSMELKEEIQAIEDRHSGKR